MRVAVLASGGKDSTYATWWALMQGWNVECLITVHVTGADSMMFQLNGAGIAALQAASAGIPWLPVLTTGVPESEISDLETSLRGDWGSCNAFLEAWPEEWEEPDELEIYEGPLAVDALVVGALRSDYQKTRIERMCDRLGIISFCPLWHHPAEEHMASFVNHGFDVRFASVSAEGIDGGWLGRRLDEDALSELRILSERHRFNLDGEGGEFETIVVDGPHMKRTIKCVAEPQWDGRRGVWNVLSANISAMR
ncbi:MAG: diphthine--ammonia ligase [Candidatus Thermoplasmatota archaeon]|nr:diphthine--ammonia ligase [Candidatus Thermoplasmatota archaeon]|tara:strand:- start:29 stop:784 length:756 start_codon:yes stop_codon:yes gene_type:complete